MQTSFLIQGQCMRLTIGTFKIPAASLNIFDCIIILFLIPVMDRIVYPFLISRGLLLTQLRRVGIGMVLASLGMVAAGVLEHIRKANFDPDDPIINTINNKDYKAANLSVLYQIPQYVLIGASEVFTSISGK